MHLTIIYKKASITEAFQIDLVIKLRRYTLSSFLLLFLVSFLLLELTFDGSLSDTLDGSFSEISFVLLIL